MFVGKVMQPNKSVDQAPACFPKIDSRLPKGRAASNIQLTSTDHGWQTTLMEISTEGAFLRLIPLVQSLASWNLSE
jgi:hypothetical protein